MILKFERSALLEPSFYSRRFRLLMTLVFILGAALLLLSAFTGEGSDIIVGDGRGHFEYARSLMIEGRLPAERIRYPCGVSMIGIVGYAPSIWMSRALGWLDAGRSASGWGLFNQFAFCLPLIALAGAGVLANLKMLEMLGFDGAIARFSLLVWFVGTNIPYYVIKEPAMSESATYSLVSIYYFLLIRAFWTRPQGAGGDRSPPGIGTIILIGAALGAASIVRQQNAVHGLALALMAVATTERPRQPSEPHHALVRRLLVVVPAAATALAIFAVPYLVWAAAEDSLSLYSYGSKGFDFLRPHLLAVLFLPGANGLFVWTPIFALAAIGLIPFFRARPRLVVPLLSVILAQWWLIASWWGYSFGTSVGHRGFFTVLPLLLPGLAALMQWARDRNWTKTLTRFLLLLCAANLVYLLLISSGIAGI